MNSLIAYVLETGDTRDSLPELIASKLCKLYKNLVLFKKNYNYLGRLESRFDGMIDWRLFQRGEQRPAPLAQRREVTADASKRLRLRTKTAEDQLLHFDHPKIPLG